MIKVMSESAPAGSPRIETGQALAGGASLKTHWTTGASRAMIATGTWDVVVIQELFNANEADFEHYAALFDGLIRTNGSRTILFATANVTPDYHKSYASFTYPEAFEKLNGMQVVFGEKKGILVAAAGYAWMKYLGPEPTKEQLWDLYAKDKGHPGAKGTYIYACLLYACITGLNPAGLASEFPDIRGGVTIVKEEAEKMQQAAWEQYKEEGGGRSR